MSKNAITGAFYCTATPLFHPLKAATICPVTVILSQNHPFLQYFMGAFGRPILLVWINPM